VQELPLAEQPAGVAQQHLQQVPLGRRQPDARVPRRPVAGYALGGQVHRQVTERDARLLLRRRAAPHGSAHPGEQLIDPERLGHVVVRARVEGLDLVGGIGAARQHDDRHRRPPAQPLDYRHAVHVGQAEVEQYQVGRELRRQRQRLGRRCRGVDLVVPHPQVDPQRPQDLRLVVNHQDPGQGFGRGSHGRSVSGRAGA
jgi:hypothetical protein